MTPPKELSTAYHEAGHAVMAYLVGMKVNGLSVMPGDIYEGIVNMDSIVGGIAQDHYIEEMTQELEKALKSEIKVLLAGVIVEGQHFSKIGLGTIPKETTSTAFNDFEQAVSHVKYLCGSPIEAIKKLDELLKETRTIISNNWNMVEGLANELHKQKTLTGKQAIKIMNRYTKGKE